MQSKAVTVEQYLAELPSDRRAALSAVREVILRNLDKDYQEGMQYGMIGYSVPHSVFPDGYHCDPRQPLPFAGLASQKGHMSLYMMCVYGDTDQHRWFTAAWAKTGKKLDMGKACIRFKKLDDLPLEVIGEAFRRVPARAYIAAYQANLSKMKTAPKKAVAGKTPAKKSTAKKAVKKAAAKKTSKKASRKTR